MNCQKPLPSAEDSRIACAAPARAFAQINLHLDGFDTLDGFEGFGRF